MNKIFLLLTFLLLTSQNLFGQKIISGVTIDNTTTWSGNIIIEGDVIVSKQGRLIIEAGTIIRFRANTDKMRSGKDKTRSELIVLGILIVKGNLDGKVVFSSASNTPRMGDWYGIRLMSINKISVLENCLVEFAYNGIVIKKSNPVIRNSQMTLNYNSGILAEVKAEPTISKNIISENGYAGIITRLGAKPILSDNLIAANQFGIIAFGTSQPNLGDLNDSKKVNQGRNNIFENSEYDIYNHSTLPLMAENNSWGDNNKPNQIASRIYDSADESKYGVVDFSPVFKKSNLDELLQISQVSTEPDIATVISDPPANDITNQNPNATVNDEITTQPSVTPALPIVENSGQQSTQESADADVEEVPEKRIVINDVKPINNLETKKAPPQLDLEQIFLEYFLDSKKGENIDKFAPQISNPALGRGAKGKIIVRAVVNKKGNVESAAVIKGLNPYYDQLSVETAQKFKYKPGLIKGNPVRFYTNIFFEF